MSGNMKMFLSTNKMHSRKCSFSKYILILARLQSITQFFQDYKYAIWKKHNKISMQHTGEIQTVDVIVKLKWSIRLFVSQ